MAASQQLLMSYKVAAGGFSPADIAGLQLWLDADQIAGASDGDSVNWSDSSGYGNDFSTGGTKPIYKTGIVNGKPVVRFGGSADLAGPGNILASNVYTLIMVFNRASSGSYMSLFSYRTGDSDECMMILSDVSDIFAGNWAGSAGYSPVSTSTWYAMSLTSNGTNTALYNSNTSIATGTTSFSTFTPAAYLGSRAGSFKFNGDIAEVILYDTSLGSTDRASIQTYLATKYGI